MVLIVEDEDVVVVLLDVERVEVVDDEVVVVELDEDVVVVDVECERVDVVELEVVVVDEDVVIVVEVVVPDAGAKEAITASKT